MSVSAKLNDLPPSRTTIHCQARACGLMTRIYRVEPQDTQTVGGFQYCPRCGTHNVIVSRSNDLDMWEAYARDYGLPIPLLKQIYALWVPSTVRRFSDFVAAVKEDALAGRLDPPEPTPIALRPNVPRLTVPGRTASNG
jgi:hypothetical protein